MAFISKFLSTKSAYWVFVVALLLTTIAIAGMINSSLISQLFVAPPDSYFDTGHYLNLVSSPKCWAFYPLWPRLVRLISSTFQQAPASVASHISQLGFCLIAFMSLKWFRAEGKIYACNQLIWSLYIMSPMTLFMLIGYTESIFSLLSWCLIFLMSKVCREADESSDNYKHNELKVEPYLLVSFILTSAMSYSRPILPQVAASVALVLTLRALDRRRSQKVFYQPDGVDAMFISILLGSLAGYSLYGIECLGEGKSFVEPFLSQTNDWDKSLGFRPIFLVTSRSPIFDLWALYYPIALLLVGLSSKFAGLARMIAPLHSADPWYLPVFLIYPPVSIAYSLGKRFFAFIKEPHKPVEAERIRLPKDMRPDTQESPNSVFFFCCTFAATHSGIVFLTQENYLYSLGRYVFGQPYFYVALAIAFPILCKNYKGNLLAIGVFALALSSIFLAMQLNNYSTGLWAG